MTPVGFPEQTNVLQPIAHEYSEDVTDVAPLPIFTNGEQVVSCWTMSWKERISALLFGRVWLALLTGTTPPPAYVTATRQYFISVEQDS